MVSQILILVYKLNADSPFQFRFRFFLCHQKNAAGSMARLLKMELEARLPGTLVGPGRVLLLFLCLMFHCQRTP